MSDQVQAFLIAYFERQRALPGDAVAEKLQCAYLDAGVIDSLGVIDLVTELESQFGIRFDNEDFEDPRFRTVGGLVAIVSSKATHR